MYDKDIACHILKQIQHSVETILARFQPVKVVADLTDSPGGMEKFDSICMLLITIGESLKNLDKVTHGQLLSEHPDRVGRSKRSGRYTDGDSKPDQSKKTNA